MKSMRPDRDFIILLIGRLAQAVLALVSIRVLTTLLDKENVGSTYLVTSMSSYFSLIFINPVGMYLNRRIHVWYSEKKLTRAFRSLNGYFFLVAIFSIPLVLVSYYFFGVAHGFSNWQIVLLIFLTIYASTWFQTLCPSLNMLEHRRAFVLINLTAQAIGLIAGVIGVQLFQKSAFIWLFGILLGQILGALVAFEYFRRHILSAEHHRDGTANLAQDQIFSKQSLFFNKEVFYFSLPIAFTTALMWGQNHSYRLIIESKMGAESLGTLAVGLGIAASIAGLVESLVNQYFYPRYYAAISKGNRLERAQAWHFLMVNAMSVYIPSMIFVAFCARFILRLLVNNKFDDSLRLVEWGALIEFSRMTANTIYVISQSEMKTKTTIFPYAIGAAVVIGGLFGMIAILKINNVFYVPYVLALAAIVVMSAMYFSMKQILPIHLDLRFLAFSFLFSSPFALAFALPHTDLSLLLSFLVCAVFGTFLLLVIWLLQKRIHLSAQFADKM